MPGGPGYDELDAIIPAAFARSHSLAFEIGEAPPARTPEGVRARAAALNAIMPVDYGIHDLVPIEWHEGMLYALLRDLGVEVSDDNAGWPPSPRTLT